MVVAWSLETGAEAASISSKGKPDEKKEKKGKREEGFGETTMEMDGNMY